MRIYVDADACPVKEIIEKQAKKNKIPVTMVIDVNHILKSDYSEVITVSQGADSVDLALINRVKKGDLVVTQDYGVATLALGKGAYAIGNSGLIYDNNNIDRLLFERFLGKKVRGGKKGNKKCARPPNTSKRTSEDNEKFEMAFEKLILKINNKE